MKQQGQYLRPHSIKGPYPLVKLIGDYQESLYQLGLKDKNHYQETFHQMEAPFSTSFRPLNFALKSISESYCRLILKNNLEIKRLITAYAEGLDRSPYELLRIYLLPEFMVSLSKYISPIKISGCSSVFTKGENGILHLRILDFPLVGSYDLHQRSLLYEGGPHASVYGASSAGLFYPSVTAMNSNGISLALHQKFSNEFDSKGIPIFQLVFDLLKGARDISDVLDYLKSTRSLTRWGINMSFPDGTILLLDKFSADVDYELKNVHEEKFVTSTNLWTNSKNQNNERTEKSWPIGFKGQCQDRIDATACKLKSIPEKLGPSTLLQALSRPMTKKELTSFDHLILDSFTCSSISIVVMNPFKGELHSAKSTGPQFLDKSIYVYDKIWERDSRLSKIKVNHGPTSTQRSVAKALYHLGLAQKYSDESNPNKLFHHLQMAEYELKNHPYRFIARFYFFIFFYLQSKGNDQHIFVMNGLLELEGKLSPYLEEQRLLFLFRIDKILGNINNEQNYLKALKSKITKDSLRKILIMESKLPKFFLEKAKNLTIPRIDLWDIIYLY